jgi:hypothetical protein
MDLECSLQRESLETSTVHQVNVFSKTGLNAA